MCAKVFTGECLKPRVTCTEYTSVEDPVDQALLLDWQEVAWSSTCKQTACTQQACQHESHYVTYGHDTGQYYHHRYEAMLEIYVNNLWRKVTRKNDVRYATASTIILGIIDCSDECLALAASRNLTEADRLDMTQGAGWNCNLSCSWRNWTTTVTAGNW